MIQRKSYKQQPVGGALMNPGSWFCPKSCLCAQGCMRAGLRSMQASHARDPLGPPLGELELAKDHYLRMFAEHAHWKIAPLRVPGEESVSHPESLGMSEPWEICLVQVRVPIRPSRSPKASGEELGLILRSPTRLRIYATTEPALV